MIVFRGSLNRTMVKSQPAQSQPWLSTTRNVVNITLDDLTNFTVSQLCQLQQDFRDNKTNQTWEFDDTSVNLTDVVHALRLEAYYSSWIIDIPFWFKFIMVSLFICCFLWSFLSNCHTVIAVAVEKSGWTSTNILIAALALSDLLSVIVITLPEITSVMNDIEIWHFGLWGCITFPFLQTSAILTNALIICLIAYDRYLGVVRLVNKGCFKEPITTAFIVVLIWIISLGIAMPQLWLWDISNVILVNDTPSLISIEFCMVFPMCMATSRSLSWDFFRNYHFCLCATIFCPLFLAILGIYSAIGHFLYVRKPIGTGQGNRQDKRRKRVLWALFSLVATFFICRIPNWIYVILIMVSYVQVTQAVLMLKSFLVFLSVLNTALNPFLYVRINETLKKTLKTCSDSVFEHMTCCGSCCQAPSLVDDPSSRSPRPRNRGPTPKKSGSAGYVKPHVDDSGNHQRPNSDIQTEELVNSGEPGLLAVSSELTRASVLATPQWAWSELPRP